MANFEPHSTTLLPQVMDRCYVTRPGQAATSAAPPCSSHLEDLDMPWVEDVKGAVNVHDACVLRRNPKQQGKANTQVSTWRWRSGQLCVRQICKTRCECCVCLVPWPSHSRPPLWTNHLALHPKRSPTLLLQLPKTGCRLLQLLLHSANTQRTAQQVPPARSKPLTLSSANKSPSGYHSTPHPAPEPLQLSPSRTFRLRTAPGAEKSAGSWTAPCACCLLVEIPALCLLGDLTRG